MDFMSKETREKADSMTEGAAMAYNRRDLKEYERLKGEYEQFCREEGTKMNDTYYAYKSARASVTAPPESDHGSEDGDETATQRSAGDKSVKSEANNTIIAPTDTTSSGELK